jgi:O-antigen biosynthesis protein
VPAAKSSITLDNESFGYAVVKTRSINLLTTAFKPLNLGATFDGTTFVVERPFGRLVTPDYDLEPGRWWLHAELEAGFSAEAMRLGILSEGPDGIHAISLDMSRADRLVTIIGGRTRIEIVPLAFPGRLAFKSLSFSKLQMSTVGPYGLRRLKARLFLHADARHSKLDLSDYAAPVQSVNDKPLGKNWCWLSPTLRAFIPDSVFLHSRAIDIIEQAFASKPDVKVLYCDLADLTSVLPLPNWDQILARNVDYIRGPIFVRPDCILPLGQNGCEILRAVMSQYGEAAIDHVPLPLAHIQEPHSTSQVPTIKPPTRDDWPLVSIVIPTKTRLDLLDICLTGLADTTNYKGQIEVVVVDNGADAIAIARVIDAFKARLELTVLNRHAPFNFSWLVNEGVRAARGEVVLLLNDDVFPVDPTWLERMVSSALEEQVGAVGAQLRNRDDTIQHAGVAIGAVGLCGHMWRGLSPDQAAVYPSINTPSRRRAVTGACLAVKRKLFIEIGGFDETNLPVTLNDVDFCLRLEKAGFMTVYRGDALLIHDESSSRGADTNLEKAQRRRKEVAFFLSKWPIQHEQDPWFSPSFDRFSESGMKLG